MLNKIRYIKYSIKIARLARRCTKAEENSFKRMYIYWKANEIELKCVELLMNDKLDKIMYAKLFKKYAKDGRHFLDRWIDEI